jgi:hypothetical protein
MKKAGVYKITLPSGKFYIGSSIRAASRINVHVKLLKARREKEKLTK